MVKGLAPRTVHKLHHFAYRCADAEQTRSFYEDVLGLPLAHLVRADHVGSTREYCPFVHIFFEMRDGSYLAFFDLGDNTAAEPSPNTPAWVNHIALEVDDLAELAECKRRLEAAGVEVLGITDHHFIKSIYFFDPNGIRLELTVRTEPEDFADASPDAARAALAAWTAEKAKGLPHA